MATAAEVQKRPPKKFHTIPHNFDHLKNGDKIIIILPCDQVNEKIMWNVIVEKTETNGVETCYLHWLGRA